MKKLFILAVITLLISCEQNNPSKNSNETLGTKKITLEDIWGTTFSTNRMNALNDAFQKYCNLKEKNKYLSTSKKNVLQYTKYRHYLKLKNILINFNTSIK